MADNQTTCATPLTTPAYGISNQQALAKLWNNCSLCILAMQLRKNFLDEGASREAPVIGENLGGCN